MKVKYKIRILLATYNGAKFISTQLDSILNQTYSNWELFISDDGSTDNTLSIIQDYCKKDSRIHVINENLTAQGACQNFGNLLKKSLRDVWDFVMFVDQDDFWYANKIQLTLDAMTSNEDFRTIPKLVFTNFDYADDQLKILIEETAKTNSKRKEQTINWLLAQNNIYGCTMMINRVLVKRASPIPIFAENHDYWIALVASLLGEICCINSATMLYRQHSNNVSGHYTDNSLKNRFHRYYNNNDDFKSITKGRYKMAEELNNRFSNELSDYNKKLLLGYAQLNKMTKFERVSFCFKNGIKKGSFFQNLAFYYLITRI